MDFTDFTLYFLTNIGNKVKCVFSDSILIENNIKDPSLGKDFTIVGFACSTDEQSILLEDKNGCKDYVSFEHFSERFSMLEKSKVTIVGLSG